MGIQVSTNNQSNPFILFANPGYAVQDGIFLQDAGRGAVALVQFTLVAKIAATGKLVPYSNEAAIDGTAVPYGIYIGPDITGAQLVAGDVVDAQVLVGQAAFDENQLVIENGKLLSTVVLATAGIDNRFTNTIRDLLSMRGLFTEDTISISGFEN